MADAYVPSGGQGAPPEALKARIEAIVGARSLAWTRPDTGLSAAHRFVVEFAAGERVFVKAATTPKTAAQLRNEHLALAAAPRRFTPGVLAWVDDDDAPLLIVEDLSHAHWPAGRGGVNWRDGDLDRVFSAIGELSALPAPAGLTTDSWAEGVGWSAILAAPDPFIALGLCSPAWLAAHGETLASCEACCVRAGEAFVHGDMRSDNICLTPDRVIFVDWSDAHAGACDTDLAIFLPAAHLEGGPAPHEILPSGAPWAAAQGAQLALRAINDHGAPDWLRRVFRRLAAINLDWAIAGLDLPPRKG